MVFNKRIVLEKITGSTAEKKTAITYLFRQAAAGEREAIALLKQLINHRDPEVKYLARKAYETLAKKSRSPIPKQEEKKDFTKDELIKYLSDYDYQKRLQAVQYIREKKLIELLPEIEKLLKNERHEFVISAAVKALAELGKDTYKDLIISFLEHPDSRVVANTIEAIEIAGIREAVSKIMQLMNHEDNRVRTNAIKAVLSLSGSSMISEISSMVYSEKVNFRDSAAYFLAGAIESIDKKFIPKIKEFVTFLLQDPVISVRKKVLEVAKKYFSDSLAELIEKVEAINEREEFINTLLTREIPDISAVEEKILSYPQFLEMVYSTNVKDRQKVIASILTIEDEEVKLYFFSRLLLDPDPDVIALVIDAAKKAGTKVYNFVMDVKDNVDLGIPPELEFTMQLEEQLRREADKIWQEISG